MSLFRDNAIVFVALVAIAILFLFSGAIAGLTHWLVGVESGVEEVNGKALGFYLSVFITMASTLGASFGKSLRTHYVQTLKDKFPEIAQNSFIVFLAALLHSFSGAFWLYLLGDISTSSSLVVVYGLLGCLAIFFSYHLSLAISFRTKPWQDKLQVALYGSKLNGKPPLGP